MPKSDGQKIKLLRLKDIFERETDEEHPKNIKELIEALAAYGIVAERKSIYRDIQSLKNYGLDICSRRERHYMYYLGSRTFEDVELKLLTDAVQSSKFIPAKYTRRIVKKLGSLTSRYREEMLDRRLYAEKTTDEEMSSLYYSIDAIYRAIESDSKIQFRYFDYTMKKTREMRRNGAYYVTSPWALLWNDGMYYLIGYDSTAEQIRHYRVDKMLKTTINESKKRDGREAFKGFDKEQYSRQYFGMYNSELSDVTLCCHKSLANLIIDRFGRKNLVMYPVSEDHFEVQVSVSVSPVFLSWAAGFGDKLVIVSPQNVRDEMKKMIDDLAKIYD